MLTSTGFGDRAMNVLSRTLTVKRTEGPLPLTANGRTMNGAAGHETVRDRVSPCASDMRSCSRQRAANEETKC